MNSVTIDASVFIASLRPNEPAYAEVAIDIQIII
jgi:hypothetical protein